MRLSTLLDRARAEIGYTEDPPGSNRTKYAIHAYEIGVAWCGTFVNAMFAGSDILPGSMFSTPYGANYYRQTGRYLAAGGKDPAPGDCIFMTFTPDRLIGHIGIVETVIGPGIIQTIEGNTSSNVASSQDNGGVVARRVRQGPSIVGYGLNTFEPEQTDEEPMPYLLITGKHFQNVFACYSNGAVRQPGLAEFNFLISLKIPFIADAENDEVANLAAKAGITALVPRV